MTESFFPFRIYASNEGWSPYEFRAVFNENRPEYIYHVEFKGESFEFTRREKFSYYCYDVIVLSQTEVEFVCFDMKDNYYGGKGKEIHRFRATVEKIVTSAYIGRRLFSRGVARREQELAEAENKICQNYANEERKELGITF